MVCMRDRPQPTLWLKYAYLAAFAQYCASIYGLATNPPDPTASTLTSVLAALPFPIAIVAWSRDVWRTIPAEHRQMPDGGGMTPNPVFGLFVPCFQTHLSPLMRSVFSNRCAAG